MNLRSLVEWRSSHRFSGAPSLPARGSAGGVLTAEASAAARHPGLYREVLLLVAALICLFLLSHSGWDYSEASMHYAVAEQILTRGELSFAQPREGIYYLAPNGRTYAAHELGNTIFLLPVAALNHFIELHFTRSFGASRVAYFTRFLFSSMGTILCAAGAAFLYLILRLIFLQPVRSALASVLIFCFCSYYWSYTRIIFDGVLCSVLLAAGTLALFLFAREPDKDRLLIAAFASFGFGVITRLSMVLPIVAAAIYLLLIETRRRRLFRTAGMAVGVLAPFVAWQLYYNHLRTGNPFLSPVQMPQYEPANGLHGQLAVGLAGLLFSPGKSIFVYCPIALLSVMVMGWFWKTHRNEAAFVSAVSLSWLLLHAKLNSWYGAWGWGPRHLVTIAPLLALPFLVARFSSWPRSFRIFAVAALSWGFVLAVASNICNSRYRLLLAARKGLLDNDRFYWNLTRNQATDAVASMLHNFVRMVRGGPYEVIPGIAARDVAASNTADLWYVTALRLGYPAIPIALTVIALAACAAICLAVLWRDGNRPSRSRHEFTPPARRFEAQA